MKILDQGPWTKDHGPKRMRYKRIIKCLLLVLCPLSIVHGPAFAQATQFMLEDTVGGKYKIKIYVVGDVQARNQIQESLYKAVDHASATSKKIDANDPSGELGAINAKQAKGEYMVSPELAEAINDGWEASEWTKGLYDITYASAQGSYKDVKIKTKTNELKIKKDGILINLDYIARGVLADQIADDMNNAGWKNVLVKLEDVFVARGNDVNGPWKVPIITPTDKLAKRALYYKATDVAAASVTTNRGPIRIIDGKTKQLAQSDLRSVTLFMANAAKAEGLAAGIYVMGLHKGKEFILKYPYLRSVLGDTQGQLIFVPEFKQ
ncbi:MAG: FAD:protein FMN transferase [Deltaproteobacteria bacterium]|nr:FAD:protein FMN transferase [Deltaproteobacteria bacterium]MDZ4224472.1 FAD:protein FMN transferase [bacterium]